MKRLLIVAGAMVWAMTWAAPAQAAAPGVTATPTGVAVAASRAAETAPTAPTAVTASAGTTAAQSILTWSSPAAAGSEVVYGYTVVKEGADTRTVYWQQAARDTTSAYSRTFGALQAGVTYTFTLKAWSLAGSSPAATVTYTPAAAPVEPVSTATLYSVDTATGSLVGVPASGGTPTVLVRGADVRGLVADGAGNLYFVDGTTHAVVKVAAGTSAVTTLATGSSTSREVVADAAGNVYFIDGKVAYKVDPAGRTSAVYTGPQDLFDLTVTPAGQLSVDYGAFVSSTVVVTVSPSGAVTSRTLDCSMWGYCADLKVDAKGTLWVLVYSSGASGYSEWMRVAVGATVPTDLIKTRIGYYGVGLDAAGTFYVAATRTFCPSPGQNTGSCAPDLRTTDILRITSGGTFNSTLAVSGLTMTSRGSDVAVDAAGRLFITAQQGLLGYAKTGGSPTVISAGSYDQLVVVG